MGPDNSHVQAQQAKNSLEAKAAKKIPKEKRTTSPFLSKYERARVLGVRANQIRCDQWAFLLRRLIDG